MCGLGPEGTMLASASRDETIKLWDIHTGECFKTLQAYLQAHSKRVFSVCGLGPEGTMLASGSEDTTIKLWGHL